MRRDAVRAADVDAHRISRLAQIDHLVIEQNLDVRQRTYSFEQERGSLELLALDHERMFRIVRESGVMKLRHQPVRRAIPKLKDRCHQPNARFFVRDTATTEK